MILKSLFTWRNSPYKLPPFRRASAEPPRKLRCLANPAEVSYLSFQSRGFFIRKLLMRTVLSPNNLKPLVTYISNSLFLLKWGNKKAWEESHAFC